MTYSSGRSAPGSTARSVAAGLEVDLGGLAGVVDASDAGVALEHLAAVAVVVDPDGAVAGALDLGEGAVDHLLEFPTSPPGGPGPFSLGDPDVIRSTLSSAGFSEIAVEPFDGAMDLVGGVDVPEAVENAIEMSPIPALVANDEDLAARVREAIGAAFIGAWEDGGVRLPYGAWIVTASRQLTAGFRP